MSVLLACVEVIEKQLRRRAVEEELRSVGQWPPPTQGIFPWPVRDPNIIALIREDANARRHQEAQPTDEQWLKITAYFGQNPTASNSQAAIHFERVFGWGDRTARRRVDAVKPVKDG